MNKKSPTLNQEVPMHRSFLRSLLSLTLLWLLSSPLMAVEYTWQGSEDPSWSNPSNWLPNGVPGAQDSVVLSGNVALSLDADREVASLKVESTYESTLSLGDKTLTINSGDFSAKYGGVDAGTSTIRFTGSEDQKFDHNYNAEYHIIFNDKSGGALKYSSWQILNLDTIKASAGTTTELSRVGRTWVNHLDIRGTSSNRSILRSGAAGERIIVHVLKGDGQTVSHTDIRDVWSDSGYGLAIDASEGGSDGGNNKGISFDYPLAYWTGAGADNNFSTADNWDDGILPTNNSILLFSRIMTNKDIVFDQDVTIAGFKTMTWNYYGTIDFASATVTITGWIDEGPGNGLNATNATLRFAGSEDQTIEFNSPITAQAIEITDTNRFVEFNDSLTLDTLDIQGGEVRFAADSTITVDNATIQGASDPVSLRPGNDLAGTMDTPWNFIVNNSATVTNTRVRAANANDGITIAATQSQDLGLNTNWTFDGALPFGSDSVIEFPTTSKVSPAFVEGDYFFNATSIVAEAHEGSLNGQSLSDSGFFLNLPLNPSGEATPVSVTFNEEELTKKEGEITWETTTLNAGGSVTIRKGDSLLFTYNDGVSLNYRIDANADGTYGDVVTTGTLLPTAFNDAGVFQVSVQADPNGSLDENGNIIFEEVAIYTVTVVDVDLRAPIAVEVGHERGKNVVITPASEISNVTFASSDPEVVEVRLFEERADGLRVSLTGINRGLSHLISRLPSGEIISTVELDEFVLSYSGLEAGVLVDTDDDSASFFVTMTPHVGDIDFEMDMYGSINSFADGETEIAFNSNDFELYEENNETVGEYEYNIIIPIGSPHSCHGIEVYQGEDPLEDINHDSQNVYHCRVTFTDGYGCVGGNVTFKVKVSDTDNKLTSAQTYSVHVDNLTHDDFSITCSPGGSEEKEFTVDIPEDFSGDWAKSVKVKHDDKTIKEKSQVVFIYQVEMGNLSPSKYCTGETVEITAHLKGHGDPEGTWSWSSSGDGDFTNADSSTANYHISSNDGGGSVTVTASYGDCSDSIGFKAVEIYEIEGDGVSSRTDEPGDNETIFVCAGDTVEFSAEPSPSGGFPTDQPVWGGAAHTGGGDAPTGKTVSVTFEELADSDTDFQVVSATCGYDSKAIRVQVGGVDLDIEGVSDADENEDGGFVCHNVDSDNRTESWDKDEEGVEGEDDLVKLTIDVSGAGDISDGKIVLEWDAENIKVWKTEDGSEEVLSKKEWEVGSTDFPQYLYVEGVDLSSSMQDIDMKLYHEKADGSEGCKDEIVLTVIEVDADVDTDNNEAVDRSDEEDVVEDFENNDDNEYPGDYIVINMGDKDADQDDHPVPDYADGIDIHDNEGEDASEEFAEFKVEILEPIDIDVAKIKFKYSASDPADIEKENLSIGGQAEDGPFQYVLPESGEIRIWTKNGNESRKKNPVDADEKGDFVPDDSELEISDLGEGRELTLYIEGVQASDSEGTEITVEIDPLGDGDFVCADVVFVRVIGVDLDADSDNTLQMDSLTDDDGRSEYEDHIESIKDNPELPGKIICINDGDFDGDGILDYNDGFNIFLSGNSQEETETSFDFTPLTLEVFESVDFDKAKIKFTYPAAPVTEIGAAPDTGDGTGDGSDGTGDGSNGTGDGSNGTGDGSNGTGDGSNGTGDGSNGTGDGSDGTGDGSGDDDGPSPEIRIWTKNGGEARKKEGANNGGDFIEDGVEYKVSEVGEGGVIDLFVEGIALSQDVADVEIKVELDPDGDGPMDFVSLDELLFTVINIKGVKSNFTSEAVLKGSYLCLNQRQGIDLKYEGPDFEGTQHVWAIDSSEGGRFLTGNTGTEVKFEQKDDFISSDINDLKINLFLFNKKVCSFPLTVFQINSTSGYLFPNETKVFDIEHTSISPSSADIKTISKIMDSTLITIGETNDDISLYTYEFIQDFDEAGKVFLPPKSQQDNDQGERVIKKAKIFKDQFNKLKVEVTAGELIGDVDIIWRNIKTGVNMHREHMTVTCIGIDLDNDKETDILEYLPGTDLNNSPQIKFEEIFDPNDPLSLPTEQYEFQDIDILLKAEEEDLEDLTLELENVSEYKGFAGNSPSTGPVAEGQPDFVFIENGQDKNTVSNIQVSNGVVQNIKLRCRDYGGKATLIVKREGDVICELKIPLDTDNDDIADPWELKNTSSLSKLNRNSDDDIAISGSHTTKGDGLAAIDEYRGFLFPTSTSSQIFRRLDDADDDTPGGGNGKGGPLKKDMFIIESHDNTNSTKLFTEYGRNFKQFGLSIHKLDNPGSISESIKFCKNGLSPKSKNQYAINVRSVKPGGLVGAANPGAAGIDYISNYFSTADGKSFNNRTTVEVSLSHMENNLFSLMNTNYPQSSKKKTYEQVLSHELAHRLLGLTDNSSEGNFTISSNPNPTLNGNQVILFKTNTGKYRYRMYEYLSSHTALSSGLLPVFGQKGDIFTVRQGLGATISYDVTQVNLQRDSETSSNIESLLDSIYPNTNIFNEISKVNMGFIRFERAIADYEPIDQIGRDELKNIFNGQSSGYSELTSKMEDLMNNNGINLQFFMQFKATQSQLSKVNLTR